MENFGNEYDTIVAAAGNGDPEAMYSLGNIFACGMFGKEINIELADFWYKMAALSAGKAYEKIFAAAKGGDADAMYAMGTVYEQGRYGKPVNVKIAGNWYEKAAQQGHKEAGDRLAAVKNSVYWNGIRFTQDDRLDDDPESLYEKGWRYEHDESVVHNLVYAKMLYEKALECGSKTASERLRVLSQLV